MENESFITKTFSIFQFTNIFELYNKNVLEFLVKIFEEFQETDSGWTLKEINFMTVHIQKYNTMRAGTFIVLPEFLANKKACVNVHNSDNLCFKWIIIAALKHRDVPKKHEQGYLKRIFKIRTECQFTKSVKINII